MALPPVLQPRRISPRQKIAVLCGSDIPVRRCGVAFALDLPPSQKNQVKIVGQSVRPTQSHTHLPVRDGTIRTEVGLGARRYRLRDFGDLGQLLEIKLDPQAGPFIGIELAVLEIQTYR